MSSHPSEGNKHPHEHETVLHPPLLRQIEKENSVVIEEEFPVPATYIEEQELAEIKQMDITKPNSLATNYRDSVVPLSKPYSSPPRFKVDVSCSSWTPCPGSRLRKGHQRVGSPSWRRSSPSCAERAPCICTWWRRSASCPRWGP